MSYVLNQTQYQSNIKLQEFIKLRSNIIENNNIKNLFLEFDPINQRISIAPDNNITFSLEKLEYIIKFISQTISKSYPVLLTYTTSNNQDPEYLKRVVSQDLTN